MLGRGKYMYESVAEPQQKIIMIELPNIAVEHIANHSDMDNELHKGCLKWLRHRAFGHITRWRVAPMPYPEQFVKKENDFA